MTKNKGEYALLEFRGAPLRAQIITGVSETVRHGFTPIIAHIERHAIFCKAPTLVDEVRKPLITRSWMQRPSDRW